MIHVTPFAAPTAQSIAFATHARGAGSVTRAVAAVRAQQHAAAVVYATEAVAVATAVVGEQYTRLASMSPDHPLAAALLAVMAPLSACRIHLTTAGSSGFSARVVDAIMGDRFNVNRAASRAVVDIASRIQWDCAVVTPGAVFARVAIAAGDDDARAWAAAMATRDALVAVEACVSGSDRVGLDVTVATLRWSCEAFADASRWVPR